MEQSEHEVDVIVSLDLASDNRGGPGGDQVKVWGSLERSIETMT